MKCDDCGHEMAIGEWPYCPHGQTMAYHPFIPFWDPHVTTRDKWEHPTKGVHMDSLAKWNRKMKENGMEMGSKYDREKPKPQQTTKGFDRAFNTAARDLYGGVHDLSGLRDDD